MALTKSDTATKVDDADDTKKTSTAKPKAKPADELDQSISAGEAKALSIANSGTNMTQFLTAGEDTGNDGMALDRTSFPVIVLEGADFVDGVTKQNFEMEGADLSKAFVFKIVAYKTRISYTVTAEGAKEGEGEYYVMVDEEHTHTGEKIADIKVMAQADGSEVSRKEYTDYTVVLYNQDDVNGETPLGMASLSVPPASRGKPAGAIMMYQVTKGVTFSHPSEAVMRATVGKKVSKDRISYYPWAFEVVGVFDA